MKKYHKQIGVGGLIISDREKELVNEVLDSNFLTYGDYTRKFEAMFAKQHACRHAIFNNSGTSSLQISLHSLKEKYGWLDGDEVLVPAVTFVATSNIVIHNNMTPVFVDVDDKTYNMDPEQIESRITNKTRAIIPVHLLGLPASMDPILDIARKYGLKVIEDSAETMFAKYKGKSVGSFGEYACFSTYVAHFIVTGIGGIVTTNDDDLAIRARSLANHGRDSIYLSATDDKFAEGETLHQIVRSRYKFHSIGYSYRCTEMEAALGIGQLENKDEALQKRKEIAEKYSHALEPYTDRVQIPFCPEDRTHSYMYYGLCLRNEEKDDMVNYLEDLNIETRDLMPVINQPIYRRLYGDLESEYPVAKRTNNSGFYIGCHSYLEDDEVDFTIEALSNYLRKK